MVCISHTVKISNLTEVSVTEMPTSDTVFQEFLKINAHARTVDTRRSFFPSPFSTPGNEAIIEEITPRAGEMACCVRSHYVYKDAWPATIGEVLVCSREPTNA